MINSQAGALERISGLDLARPAEVLAQACRILLIGTGGLAPLLAQIPMTVRLQLLAENFARLRRQNPDKAITGAWDEPALWRLGAPAAP